MQLARSGLKDLALRMSENTIKHMAIEINFESVIRNSR